MRYRSWALAASSLGALGVFLLQACSSDNGSPSPGPDAATPDATSSDAAADVSADVTVDASDAGATGDAGDGAATVDASDAAVPVFLAHFDITQNQRPEGLWTLGDAATPIVGFAPLALLATVTSDGGSQTFGSIGDASAVNSDTLGITTDVNGNVYVGVGTTAPDAGPVPVPGVYRFGPDGGAAVLFSSAPGMNFVNGLDFIGNNLFVADSDGAVYSVSPAGVATVWSSDPLLAPDMNACDAGLPLPVGANGIVHDANNVYVTNTNHGRIVKIPMGADGGAGTATTIIDDCSLVGADGLALDTVSNTFLVALNVQNRIARVTMTGQVSDVVSGGPLDFPASLVINSTGGQRRLLFTNAALLSAVDAGRPGVLFVPIP